MKDEHINIEYFVKQTRQQIKELKQAVKKLDSLIHQDFGLLINLNDDSVSFLGGSSKYAKKLYEAQNEASKVVKEVLKKH